MAENKPVVLFESKEKCCACGACVNVCPKQAIQMVEDGYGFLYPQIDDDLCVGCGACKTVCAYQNTEESNTPVTSYAAVNKDVSQKLLSASGGLFAACATKVLKEGGVVFGCALDNIDDKLIPHHVEINSLSELTRLQGSKYVQSATERTFSRVKELLNTGVRVLYSGTPCQIAGLKSYLRKDYDNLILIDLICHGVPSTKFFNDFLDLEKEKRGYQKITGYSFRDKKKGWGMNCRIDAIDKSGKQISYYTPARLASYNTLFLDGLTYRKNCYTCKYAGKHRPGDITIGDYWGIVNEHPELIGKDGFEEKDGISCLISNTAKGQSFCEEAGLDINMQVSTYEKIAKMNKQLNHPSELSPKRDKIMDIYREDGYIGVSNLYKEKYRKQRIVHFIYNKIPRCMRTKLKSIIKK